MNTYTDKTKENKNQSVANALSENQSGSEPTFQFVNNRPKATVQRKLREMVGNSPQVSQLIDLQEIANNGSPTQMVVQRKAGVESFEVNWAKLPEDDGESAAFEIDSTAKFKHGDGFNADDAEFRQNAGDKQKITGADGRVKHEEATALQDDGYSRTTDPDDYTGDNKENFATDDIPGWLKGDNPLAPDDTLDWTFTAEQMIVDTSDFDKNLEKKGPKTVKVTGKYPRDFEE